MNRLLQIPYSKPIFCSLFYLCCIQSAQTFGQALTDDFPVEIQGWPRVLSIVPMGDGGGLLGGNIKIVDGQLTNNLVKIDKHGIPEFSFVPEGLSYSDIFKVIVTKNNKILVFQFSSPLQVLNSNGKIDSSFTLSEQIDFAHGGWPVGDQFIIKGFTFESGSAMWLIDEDGTVDPNFHFNYDQHVSIRDLVVQNDGKYIAVGRFNQYDGSPDPGIIRLNMDGTIDSTFHSGIGIVGDVLQVELFSDESILLAGTITSYNGVKVFGGIVKLHSDGSIDPTYDYSPASDILGTNFNFAPHIEIDDNDQIIALGGQVSNHMLFRLHSNGIIDTTFNINKISGGNIYEYSLVYDSAKIFIGGDFKSIEGELASGYTIINESGEVVSHDFALVGSDPVVREAALQDDGKILLAGDFMTINNIPKSHFVRIDQSGKIDSTFQHEFDNTKIQRASIIEIQSTGDIIVGGLTNLVDHKNEMIIRLKPDGSVDKTFLANIENENFGVGDLKVLKDDKILIGGGHKDADGWNVNGLYRLHSDGIIDTTFDYSLSLGSNMGIRDISFGANEQIYVGGYTTGGAGWLYSMDKYGHHIATFNQFFNLIYSVLFITPIESNIVIFGGRHNAANSTNSSSTNSIIQIDSSGINRDVESLIIPYNSSFEGALVLNNQDLVIYGAYASINGVMRAGLSRATLNGKIDDNFVFNINDGESSLNGGRVTQVIQADQEHIYVFGSFHKINDSPRFGAAKISLNSEILAVGEERSKNEIVAYPNPAKSTLTLIEGNANTKAIIFDTQGRQKLEFYGKSTNIRHLPNGIYYLRIFFEVGRIVTTIIIKK